MSQVPFRRLGVGGSARRSGCVDSKRGVRKRVSGKSMKGGMKRFSGYISNIPLGMAWFWWCPERVRLANEKPRTQYEIIRNNTNVTHQSIRHHVVDVRTRVDLPFQDKPRARHVLSRPVRFDISTMHDEKVGRMGMTYDILEPSSISRQVTAISVVQLLCRALGVMAERRGDKR